MTTADLLDQLDRHGVSLRIHDGALRWSAPAGTMTDDLRAILREHKAGLVALLASAAPSATAADVPPPSVAGRTIAQFACSGRVIRLESPEFGRVALVADGVEAPAGFVGYTSREMARLFAMTPEERRLVHAVKREFVGRLLDSDEMLPTTARAEATTR